MVRAVLRRLALTIAELEDGWDISDTEDVYWCPSVSLADDPDSPQDTRAFVRVDAIRKWKAPESNAGASHSAVGDSRPSAVGLRAQILRMSRPVQVPRQASRRRRPGGERSGSLRRAIGVCGVTQHRVFSATLSAARLPLACATPIGHLRAACPTDEIRGDVRPRAADAQTHVRLAPLTRDPQPRTP